MTSAPFRYRLLVVDDDVDHVFLIHAVFAHWDHRAAIEATRTGEEAIAYLNECRPATDSEPGDAPDVIILDMNMPGMGGRGFLRWHGNSECADIPVVVFTTDSGGDIARECLDLGASAVQEKTIDFAELVPVVQRVLEKREPGVATGAG